MRTKLICLLAILTIISSYFVSCTKDTPTGVQQVDTSTFKFPFNIGNTWSYTRVQSVENIRPDSIINQFNMFPFISTSTITISHDTIINGVQTRCFKEIYTEDTTNMYCRTYYANYDSGLVCYGYSNAGSIGIPFSPTNKNKFLYNGNVYNSINEIFISYGQFSNPKFPTSDTLSLENPPVNCIKYPIVIGMEWFFKRIDNNLYLHKKYLGYENILANYMIIRCVKTERIWFGMNSELYFYDYHSKYGQIKRDYYIKNIIVLNEFGYPIGFLDARDVANVTSFNIVNP
ncbi:hypothetical protein ACFLSV_08430 [Bacteroidota bacterium]